LTAAIALDPAALAGLRRETARARRLAHPNIVRVHDLIDPPGEPSFISMEFVDGSNLHAIRCRHPAGVLRWDYLEPLFEQAALALESAHGEGIVHQDIKPSNLLVHGGNKLKLADFGLAQIVSARRADGDSAKGWSSRGGTLEYMSPQQAAGEPPTVADDLYSLGATFYELVTGSTPLVQDAQPADRLRATDFESAPLDQRQCAKGLSNPIPAHISDLLTACLARDPARRPPGARAILDVLARHGQGPTPPPLAFQPERPDARRRRSQLVASTIGVSLGAIVLGGWMLWPEGPDKLARGSPAAGGSSMATLPVNGSNVPALTFTVPALDGGFVSLFNGRDLMGWSGEPGIWRVEDGAITAWAAEEGVVRRQNTCLVWEGEVSDFELRLQFRQDDVIAAKPANSGVLYRAQVLTNWQVRGFQVDLHGEFTGSLLVLREDGQDPRAGLGHFVRVAESAGRTTIRNLGLLTEQPRELQSIRRGDWNDLVIIARGPRIIHQINGVTTVEAEDATRPLASLSGKLALELKRATRVQFRDIRLRRL
jgi:hypothetical protein